MRLSGPASAAVPSPLDTSQWPIVRFTMPEHVPDAAAEAQLAEFEALLARNARFVLVTAGPVVPSHSKRFMQLYGDWSRRSQDDMARLCAGFIRLEPDDDKRRAYADQLTAAEQRGQVPYPSTVVSTEAEVQAQAARWLGNNQE